MIKIYVLIISVVVEFTTLLLQLGWTKKSQILEVAELGEQTTTALFERGILGLTSIIFLGTSFLLGKALYSLIKDHKKEIINQSKMHEERIQQMSMTFNNTIEKSQDIMITYAKNETAHTEIMRQVLDNM